jgi:hypothetical protein
MKGQKNETDALLNYGATAEGMYLVIRVTYWWLNRKLEGRIAGNEVDLMGS